MPRVYDGFITIDGIWHRGLNREREPLQWLSLTRPPTAWQAERYEGDVAAVLDRVFLLSHTGAALRQSIMRELVIVPWVERGKTSVASHSPGPASSAPGDAPHLRTLLRGLATHGVAAGRTAGAIGRGVSVCDCPDLLSCARSQLTIAYTPEQYPASPVSGSATSGNCRDEVLLHEMVHSVRRMASLAVRPNIAMYDNMDEFAAILVANYYSAEQGRGIRNSHHGHARISCRPQDWLDARVSPEERPNRHYLELFCRQQAELAARLADSPQTAFNPIRQMGGAGG
ncbi:MAG: hypothetical protein JXR37_16535 [Kiritimatiellae bacterium]|nr:hypothetical protein [Kiritimatiellia bacterium]